MNALNLLNYDKLGLEKLLFQWGEKPFRGRQLFKWIHQLGITDFDQMTDLSKSLRQRLKQLSDIRPPQIKSEKKSKDGTIKWLLTLCDNNAIEMVYIPEDGRGTLCVSSQVGCALACTFCSTGAQGYNRNLSLSEIIGQVWLAVRRLSKNAGHHDRQITNIVMMGMGEPLLNFTNVVKAMDIMMDDLAYGLSKYRVTLSTSGVVPKMRELAKISNVSLALSLHAPNDALRSEIVPINKKYPIAELMEVCREFFKGENKRYVTMEYVMLKAVNDSDQHARELINILKNVPVKVNLIPFNPFPGSEYQCSSKSRIDKFRTILTNAGINTITRKTRGDDIDAACGQLVGQVIDRTLRSRKRQLNKLNNIPVIVNADLPFVRRQNEKNNYGDSMLAE